MQATPAPASTAAPVTIGQVTVSAAQVAAPCPDQSVDSNTLMAGGILLLRCGDSSLAAVDAVTGSQLWTKPAVTEEAGQVLLPGTEHVFVVTSTMHPAEGLNDEYVTRELAALDPRTGHQAWAVPLEDWLPKADRDADLVPDIQLVESGGAGTPLSPLVGINVGQSHSWSGFNAGTGTVVWTVKDVTKLAPQGYSAPDYVGDGVMLSVNSSSYAASWSATDADTGATLWTTDVPLTTQDAGITLDGVNLWQVSTEGVLEVDVRTGRIGLSRRFPSEWIGTVASRSYALAQSGSAVQMVTTADVRSPLWSSPAGSITPRAVSADLAIVDAPSGLVVLDGRTGEPRTDVDTPALQGTSWAADSSDIVDGLKILSDGSVFAIGRPAASAP